MKKRISILAIMAAILLAALAASPVGANSGRGEVIGVTGIVPGQDLIVHILALVPPGANRNEVAKEALANQGARALTSQGFTTIDITWDQFDVLGDGNDFVEQYYNPDNQPAGVSSVQLSDAQATWTHVATSVFAFSDAGLTSRCPSLVKECRGKQKFDGFNDAGWLPLKGNNTLGFTWSGTEIDEEDMALNTNFNWTTDEYNTIDFDVETVFLHESGHALGLGHSLDITAVMFASYQTVARSLTTDDKDGVSFKYPVPGSVSLAITTTSLANGTVGDSYSATLTAIGGVSPYSWAVTSGSLPAGLSLSGNTISGTPTTMETQNFTVQVMDSESPTAATDSASLSIAVADAPEAGTLVGVTGFSYSTAGGRNGDKNLRVTVSVADDTGAAVDGASVSIKLSNDTSGGPWFGTASTGTNGTVTFQLRNAPDGRYTALVTGISAAGLDWDNDDGSDIDPGFDKSSGNLGGGNSAALEAQ